MNYIEIIELITFYGVDVIVLAAITSAVTQALKNTLFKNADRKIVTLLPFVIGIILYTVYTLLSRLSFDFLAANWVSTLEGGFSVGASATILYVLYEQFIRGVTSASATQAAIAEILWGYVDEGKEESVAACILEQAKLGEKVENIIRASVQSNVDDMSVKLIARAVEALLAHMK